MTKCLFYLLMLLPCYLFSAEPRIYGYGSVNVRVLDSSPEFQKCDGELLNTFHGLNEKEILFYMNFLDYTERLDSFLGESSIISIGVHNSLEFPIIKLNDNSNLYLIRLNIVHPNLLDIRDFTFRYYDSKCIQIVQAAPGYVDVNFYTFAIMETPLDISRVESRGSWY